MTQEQSLFTPAERALLEARARAAAAPPPSLSGGSGLDDLVVVRSGADLYGLRAGDIHAVAELTRMSPVPHAPAAVAGLTVFRGTVLVVFHLYAVLGCPPSLSEHGRMIVVDEGCALAVDVVERLEAVERLRPAPKGLRGSLDLIRGVTSSGVAVLDVPALLASERLVVDIPMSDIGRYAR